MTNAPVEYAHVAEKKSDTPEAVHQFKIELPYLSQPFDLNQLPSFPAVILKLNYYLDQNRAPIKYIIRTILSDPALSLRVLSLLSLSSNYNPQNPLTISRAVHFKGLRPIRELVTDFSIFNENRALEQHSGFTYSVFWKNAVFTALAAETIAAEMRLENLEEAYLAGLLHDIGKLILARFSPETHKKFIKFQARQNEEESLILEQKLFGADHVQAGVEVAKKLRLPYRIVDVIQNHHLETYSPQRLLLQSHLAKIVHVAEAVAKLFYLRELSTHYFYEGRDRAVTYLEMPAETYRKIVRQVSNKIYDLMDHTHLTVEEFQNYGKKLEDISKEAEILHQKLKKAEKQLSHYRLKDDLIEEILPTLIDQSSKEVILKTLTAALNIRAGIPNVVLFLFDRHKMVLQSKLNYGLKTNDTLRWAKLEFANTGVLSHCLKQKRILRIRTYNEKLKEQDMFNYEEFKFLRHAPFALIPLYTPKEEIGVIYLSSGEPNEELDEDFLNAIYRVCQMACRAIEKAEG